MDVCPSTSELVCLQCGDVGFSNACIYCVKCLRVFVHRYCLDVIPKSLDEFVPWLCDYCEAENKNQQPLLNMVAISTKKKEIVAPKVPNPVLSESESDCHTVSLGMKDEDMVLSAANKRTKCNLSNSQLLEEEIIKDDLSFVELSATTSHRDGAKERRSDNAVSIMRKHRYTVCNNPSDRPEKVGTHNSFNEHAKLVSDSTLLKDVKGIKASLKRENSHHHSDPETASPLPSCTLNSGSEGRSQKMTPDMPSSANLKDQKSLFPQDLKKQKGLDLGTLPTYINQIRKPKVTKDRIPASNPSYSFNGFQKDLTFNAEPVMESIWRGSFSIFNYEDDMLDDMMAHLSISACPKVYNEARQFKPVLDLEMMPRAHVWPQSFEKSGTICQNIALYFFPSERCERFYDDLVDDMVEEELALKAIVKNAELLVFPSTKLPLSNWRFKGKYYLWGVFRKKQPLASCSASCEREPRYNPVMRRHGVDDNDGSISIAVMNNFGDHGPLSPLSNCSSYGSRTS